MGADEYDIVHAFFLDLKATEGAPAEVFVAGDGRGGWGSRTFRTRTGSIEST